jgi:hypothetical protein
MDSYTLIYAIKFVLYEFIHINLYAIVKVCDQNFHTLACGVARVVK